MVANILPADRFTPCHWSWGQKVSFQLFQYMAMLHIKLKGIMNAATWYQIFCLQTSDPRDGVTVNRSKVNFFRTWSCCISN